MTRDGGLAHDGEGLDQQVVEVGAVVEALAELGRLGLQLVVGQPLHLGLERVDVGDHPLEGLELLAFAGAEDAVEDAHAGFEPTGWPGNPARGESAGEAGHERVQAGEGGWAGDVSP